MPTESLQALAEEQLESRAKRHAVFCPQCASVVVRYRDRIRRPWSQVPPDVATAIRAACCKDGALIIDALLGVRS